MNYRKLGNSDLTISVVSFGCWQMAGGFAPAQEQDFIDSVNAALDAGINLFDTAEAYGAGLSEQILGRALKNRRGEALIATKIFTANYDLATVEQHLDKSLANLQTDYVDLYQYHWPRAGFDQQDAEDAMSSMLKMVEKGKVRAFGVSNFLPDQMQACLEVTDRLVSNQPPYSLLWREVEAEILPFCREHGIGTLAYSPLAQGLLTGKYDLSNRPVGKARSGDVMFKEGYYEKALRVVDVIRPIAEAHGKSIAQVAVNWLISQPGVTTAICGATRPQQATDNAAATGWTLTAHEVETLSRAGLEFWESVSGFGSMWERRADAVRK